MSFSPSASSVSRAPSTSSDRPVRKADDDAWVSQCAAKLAACERLMRREIEADEGAIVDDHANARTRNEAAGWDFHGREADIDVYTRRDGCVNLCKGVGSIQAPLAIAKFMFEDNTGRAKWDHSYEGGRSIESNIGELGINVGYLAYKAPWPVTPRDVCIASRAIHQADGSVWLLSVSVEHPACPVLENYIRADLICSASLLRPQGKDACHVTVLNALDPRGDIPEFVVKANSVTQPLCIDTMRQHIKQNRTFLGHIVDDIQSKQDMLKQIAAARAGAEAIAASTLQANVASASAGETLPIRDAARRTVCSRLCVVS